MTLPKNGFFYCIGLSLLLGSLNTAMATPGFLADEPLFAKNSSQPNVFFEVDDSGSMDFEILTKKHWEACAYKTGNKACELVDNGLFRSLTTSDKIEDFTFLTDNNDNTYNSPSSHCNAGDGNELLFTRTLDQCSTSNQEYDWRVKSSSSNVIYYNPNVTYKPWENGDNTKMPAAVFNAAKSDPQLGSTGNTGAGNTKNLNGFVYHVWSDTHGFTGEEPSGASNREVAADGNGLVDWWDEHLRYTVNASSVTVDKITYTGSTEVVSRESSLSAAATSDITNIQQNIANWYQYARRRSFVAKSAIAKVITAKPDYRFGLNFINNSAFPYDGGTSSFVEMPADSGSTVENTKLISGLFSFDWPPNPTPLRQGLERVGRYYDNADGRNNPIIEECQQNYSILITDGYWNGEDPSSSIGDADGDGHSLTVADVAKYYYDRDLSGLPNNPSDPVSGHQHMETYTVAFGLAGLLADTDVAEFTESSAGWGDPSEKESPEKIDDLWHAAFNSNGVFVSASTPMAVAEALEAALVDIDKKAGGVASFTFNGTSLSENNFAYNATFIHENKQWGGDLLSFRLNEKTGAVEEPPRWSAAKKLEERNLSSNPRNIFTYNGTEGKSFSWGNLTSVQQDDLKVNPDATNSDIATATARLNYLKGDKSNEGSSGDYVFKERSSLMGDIVHSDPVYTGKPNSLWPNTAPFPENSSNNYSSFKASMASRDGMIYVGANDGMLHGFNAADGSEVLAYIPSNIFSATSASVGLHYLTDPDYVHNYYVDMPVTIADAHIDKTGTSAPSWHTVLISGGRGGSKGLFALDITDPAQFGDTSYTQNQVIWEFDDTDDVDLGFTYSKPSIVMMNNGRWAAIFGNGYNNTGSGDAALYIVFLDVGDGGADNIWTDGIPGNKPEYIKVLTHSGTIVESDCNNAASNCNGLSTPQAVDLNGDKVTDRIYAGDLKGNMWAFDVKDSNANHWGVAYPDTTSASPEPLFTASYHETPGSGDPVPSASALLFQPITSKPITEKHPDKLGDKPDVMVFFGTGQYLTDADVENTDVQSFYGVWDNGTGSLTPEDLVEQMLLPGTLTNSSGGSHTDVTSQARVLTDNEVDYSGGKKGWFFNLPLSGERLVVDPDIRGETVNFNTRIPSTDACNPGGSSFVMFVNQKNGGRPEKPAFDFNGDDAVDTADLVITESNGGGAGYAPSGKLFNQGKGMAGSSSFLGDKAYIPGTKGNMVIKVPPLNDIGRLSWEELRK